MNTSSVIFPDQNNEVYDTYTPFRNAIRKSNLTSSLRAIHGHLQHMQFKQAVPAYIRNTPMGYAQAISPTDFIQFYIHPWELDIMVKELIIHGDRYGNIKTFEDWNYMAHTVNKLKALEEKIAQIYSTKDNVLTEIHRISHRQFIWQNPPDLEDLARYWKVYSDKNLNQIIIDSTGLSIDEIYLVALTMTGLYLTNFAFNYPPQINIKNLGIEHLDKFLKHFSLPLEELKNKLVSEQQMNEKYAYAFNSLRAYPLIRMSYQGKDSIVCPIPTLLFRRVTEGIYYEIFKDPRFDNAFGESFQTFIGELIKNANPKAQVIPEEKYGTPEKRTIDWIMADKSGILFIECKGKRLTLNAKINLLDTTELENQLDIMASFIVQMYKTLIDYQNNKYPSTKYDKDRVVYPILVTLEEWYVFGDKILELLNPKIKSRLQSSGIPLTILKSNPYGICSVEGLDYLAQICSMHSISSVLQKKDNPTFDKWQLENFLRAAYKDDFPKLKPIFKKELSDHVDYVL